MACTKEEIERKRLAALQKRQNNCSNIPNSCNTDRNILNLLPDTVSANISNHRSSPGPIKNNTRIEHKIQSPYSSHVRNKTNRLDSHIKTNGNKFIPTKVISGTVYLISENRFEVKPSDFCAPLIDIFKTISSKIYDGKTKLWNFSIENYQELMSKVAPLAPDIVLGPLPSYVLKVLEEHTPDPSNVDLSPIESTLRNKLMPFQEDGVKFGIAHRGRCMIADDMGLGKTFQALAIASYYKHDWPLLIVTTSSMRGTWQSKIHELLPSVPMVNVVTLTSNKDAAMVADRQSEVVIVSFKTISMHKDLLKSKKFGVIIVDESHNLKSHKAQCTTSLSMVSREARRCVLLSGTPALSRPAELYTQLELIHPKLFPSFTEYGKRYCNGKLNNFGWDMTGQSNLAELQVILQKCFLIRRTKEQVLTILERKTREQVFLDQSLLNFSKEAKQELSQMAAAYTSTKSTEKQAALLTFFSESAKVKIPAICKYIKQLLREETTEKFLVFAHHKCMIDAICETLDELCVHYICIVGSTPTAIRAELVERFQEQPSCRCAVLSVTAASSGLTLTAATLVLFAELHWNPGTLTQAECRAHRLGQRGAVCARYLLAAGTVDDYMWPLLQDKLSVLNEAGLSKDTFDDVTTLEQESKNNITQYLTPSTSKEYIPGTNIRRGMVDAIRRENEQINESKDDGDKTFLNDDEDDELLAELEL